VAGQQDHAPVLSPAGSLPRPFFDRDPRAVARDLLGCVLEHWIGESVVGVRLTEVEAYLGQGEDPASHSHRGRTARNAVMFGPPGHAYIYFTYGMHWCTNVVCLPEGLAGAVLLRAGTVVSGLEIARSRRPAARKDAELARGPARLASAVGLTGTQNGLDVCGPGSDLRFVPGPAVAEASVRTGPRVGVSVGAVSAFRWWVDGEESVSLYRPAKPRRATPSP
jgi:DNA-3-methyladenine glycosylase